MKIGYWCVFKYRKKNQIEIYFPDLEDAFTCAENEDEGKKYAAEVLELITYNYRVKELPRVTPKEEIRIAKNEKVFFIEYESSETTVIEFE